MDLEEYYPETPIVQIEQDESTIIIHTAEPEKEVRTIQDLPIFGKGVVIRVTSDADYPWIDKDYNMYTVRLNEFILSCMKAVPDSAALEKILGLDNIRISPTDPIDIFISKKKRGKSNSTQLPAVKTQTRGAKTRIDYERLIDEISYVLENGILEEIDESDYCKDEFGNTYIPLFPPSKEDLLVRRPVSSYRELQEYLLNTIEGLDTLSLETLHKVMHTYFPGFNFPSTKPANISSYGKSSVDFGQMHFDSLACKYQYKHWGQYYKQIELKPVRISIKGNRYDERLDEAKSLEVLSITVSAEDFKQPFRTWLTHALSWCRLIPAIQIKNQTLFFQLMEYDVEQRQFFPIDELTTSVTKIRSYVNMIFTIQKFLYLGPRTYGLQEYSHWSSIDDMEIPEYENIEIGIGDCIRFSTSKDTYLVQTLEVKEHIV